MTEPRCARCGIALDHDGVCPHCARTTSAASDRGRLLGTAALGTCGALLVGGYVFSGSGSENTPAQTASSTATIVVTPAAGASSQWSTTEANPSQVAASVSELLASSGQQQGLRHQALDCRRTGLEDSRRRLQQAVVGREHLLAQARNLNIGVLSNGGVMAGSLRSAWGHSLAADKEFRLWAQARHPGGPCNTYSAHYRAGQAEALRSERYGRQFLDLWRPVARSYGLPQATASSL